MNDSYSLIFNNLELFSASKIEMNKQNHLNMVFHPYKHLNNNGLIAM